MATAPVSFKEMTLHQQYKLLGFWGVGGVFVIVGAVLMGVSEVYALPKGLNVDSLAPGAFREALRRDRTHDSLFAAGVSFLTSGLLILLGFGLTEWLANRHAPR